MRWTGCATRCRWAVAGFNIELVGPDRVAELHPFYNLDGVLGALHTPDDGHVDPTNVTMAMAPGRGPRARGSSAAAARPTSRRR
jgi:glycine/D-amino acid oxidase-like deaminating enzyme